MQFWPTILSFLLFCWEAFLAAFVIGAVILGIQMLSKHFSCKGA